MKRFLASLLLLSTPVWSFVCPSQGNLELAREVENRLQDLSCGSGKRVHLTFDDGPHPVFTPKLLEELNKRKVKTTFFVSTTNITPERTTQREIVKSAMDSGHFIGSHGHHHEAYDLRLNVQGEANGKSMNEKERTEELRLTSLYLDQATAGRFSKQRPKLFRFPYGRGVLPSDSELELMQKKGMMNFSSPDRQVRLHEYRLLSEPLQEIGSKGYGHLLWNHDSMDSTTSAPNESLSSKANYIVQNLAGLCKSPQQDIVSLFHDIKSFNPEAVGIIIDMGKCLGLKFVSAGEILTSPELVRRGTYISKDKILGAPVSRMDEIGELLKDLACEDEKTPLSKKNSCYSKDMNRTYGDCESGNVSICIRGSWFQRTDLKEEECRARGL